MSKLQAEAARAAEAVAVAAEAVAWAEAVAVAVAALAKAEAEADLDTEYELWGTIQGAPGGRWVTSQLDPYAVYPVGTALYVRRVRR